MRFASDRINQFATDTGIAKQWDPSNLAGTLGTELAQTASVTMSPIGGGKFRVFEKNDGDPTFYTAPDVTKPHMRKAVRTEQVRDPNGGWAYPREGIGPGMQAATGHYTKDGNHLTSIYDEGGSAYDRPEAKLWNGGMTQSPASISQVANKDQYTSESVDWTQRNEGANWKGGTNSFVLDRNNPADLERIGGYFGN